MNTANKDELKDLQQLSAIIPAGTTLLCRDGATFKAPQPVYVKPFLTIDHKAPDGYWVTFELDQRIFALSKNDFWAIPDIMISRHRCFVLYSTSVNVKPWPRDPFLFTLPDRVSAGYRSDLIDIFPSDAGRPPKSIEQTLKLHHPETHCQHSWELRTWDQGWEEHERLVSLFYCSMPWELISLDRYVWSFEALPPIKWHSHEACESFCMVEMFHHDITRQYLRLDANTTAAEELVKNHGASVENWGNDRSIFLRRFVDVKRSDTTTAKAIEDLKTAISRGDIIEQTTEGA